MGHNELRKKSQFEKYRNFTWFPGVEILGKGTFSAQFPFRKISTLGNQVKLRYFSQCHSNQKIKKLNTMQMTEKIKEEWDTFNVSIYVCKLSIQDNWRNKKNCNYAITNEEA